jgi:hypothetical protein
MGWKDQSEEKADPSWSGLLTDVPVNIRIDRARREQQRGDHYCKSAQNGHQRRKQHLDKECGLGVN